jgi:ABC-2 type transport system ATP-binding protein
LRRRFELRPDALVGRLSKGEAGKLMMLLALSTRPDLLVLDEPTDGLDPVVRRDVLSAVVDYVATNGATVFISSHLVHEQERICQWVGVLDAGRMVAELPMETFRAGIKRLRVTPATEPFAATPFKVLARRPLLANDEEWVVSAWRPDMRSWFDGVTPRLRAVEDLDLEESFVELLNASRTLTTEAA